MGRRKGIIRTGFGAGMVLMFTVLLIIFSVGGYISAKKQFDKEVHGHLMAAYWSNTPELMIDELTLCVGGVYELGLDEEDYGCVFSWDKTPDNKVDYWIRHLENITVRAYAVILWRDAAYSNGSTPESLADVYEQKMNNLRKFIKTEGWSDETIRKAYYADQHILWYFAPAIITSLVILIIVSIIIVIWGAMKLSEDEYYGQKRRGYY